MCLLRVHYSKLTLQNHVFCNLVGIKLTWGLNHVFFLCIHFEDTTYYYHVSLPVGPTIRIIVSMAKIDNQCTLQQIHAISAVFLRFHRVVVVFRTCHCNVVF
jgi:hypothetical protein